MPIEPKYLLTRDKPAFLRLALKKFDKTEEDLRRDIKIVRDWAKAQPHWPEVPNDNIIMNFIIINKFALEVTKEKLDMYYTIRSILPELFLNKHPKTAHMQNAANLSLVVPLPKVLKEGYRVTVFKLADDSTDTFDVCDMFAHSYNIAEIRINEDVTIADILIQDGSNIKLGHVVQMTPMNLKKALMVLERVFSNRLKQMHYVNIPPYAQNLLTVMKSLLKPKLGKRIIVHKSVDTLADYIPRETLPVDYGGEEVSLYELNKMWRKKLEEYQDRFDKLNTFQVKEEMRPAPLKNDDILGFHGNFKKLAID